MAERLKSRKFWVTVLAAVTLVVSGAEVDPDTFVKLVMAYIGGQSAVDLAAALKKPKDGQ